MALAVNFHHAFPISVLESFAPELAELYPEGTTNPFSAEGRWNKVVLFVDAASAQALGGAGTDFGGNFHPVGNTHTGLREFLIRTG